MSAITTVKARNDFSTLINRAAFGKERIVLTRRGKEIVAVIPIKDMKRLEEIEERLDVAEAVKALKEAKKKGTVSWQKLKKELGL